VASAAAQISPSPLDALIALAEAGLHASARERLLALLAAETIRTKMAECLG
jgi:hypothetical protein